MYVLFIIELLEKVIYKKGYLIERMKNIVGRHDGCDGGIYNRNESNDQDMGARVVHKKANQALWTWKLMKS